MHPVIGITSGLSDNRKNQLIHRGYLEGVLQAGGTPLLMPLCSRHEDVQRYIGLCDGFLFSGGPDIAPAEYGEDLHACCGPVNQERDGFELPLMRELLRRGDKPVFAVCRGIQVLNVALGGTLYQDLSTEFQGIRFHHNQDEPDDAVSHPVTVVPGTLLHRVTGLPGFSVNSLHHQAVRDPAPSLEVCGHSSDGVIESVALPGHPFCLGVQWHPERLYPHDPVSFSLFAAFVRACSDMKAQA